MNVYWIIKLGYWYLCSYVPGTDDHPYLTKEPQEALHYLNIDMAMKAYNETGGTLLKVEEITIVEQINY